MTNDECLKNDECRMTNDESHWGQPNSAFVILPLAQIDKWHEMGRDFQTDHSKLAPNLIIASLVVLAIVVAFLWLLVRLMNRQEGRRLFTDQKQLFRGLCRAHELNRADRRLMTQMGRVRQISQPADLFLDPAQFDLAMENPTFHGHEGPLKILRDRLFGEPPAAAELANTTADPISSTVGS